MAQVNNYADFLVFIVCVAGGSFALGQHIERQDKPAACEPIVRYVRWTSHATPDQLRRQAAELRTMAATRERMERVR